MNILNVKIIMDEDDTYIAYFEEMPNISAGGENTPDALRELAIAFELAKDENLNF